MLNSWGQLAKIRPGLTQLVVSTLTSWTPAALSGLDATSVKSAEKAVRILMIHLSR
jgi:symplekin